MKTWTTKDGKQIKYKDLEDSHLLNILALLRRKAKAGVRGYRQYGFDLLELEFVEETLYDNEALEELGYYELLEEAKKRKLLVEEEYV